MLTLEGRAPWEYAALLAAARWLHKAPRGDGHPVLVFPGLTAGDLTTRPLRRFLSQRGYAPYAWGQGLNFGPRTGVVEACVARARALVQQHGRPVSLIGWSLGGVYAREVAKELAGDARCVVTLGAPFAGHPHATRAWRLYELVSGQSAHDAALLKQVRMAPTAPTTSIYSRSDAIVAWECSLNEAAPHTENIEIHSSHVGMGMNPLAMYVIADRLAQDPQHWKRFDPSGSRKWFFKQGIYRSADADMREPGRAGGTDPRVAARNAP
jgi:pimeloyl-ACP methyl ester carboxylesterase